MKSILEQLESRNPFGDGHFNEGYQECLSNVKKILSENNGDWKEGFRKSYEALASWSENEPLPAEKVIALIEEQSILPAQGLQLEQIEKIAEGYHKSCTYYHGKLSFKEYALTPKGKQLLSSIEPSKPEPPVSEEGNWSFGKLITVNMLMYDKGAAWFPEFPEDVLEQLKADSFWPNSVPIIVFKNMLRHLGIGFAEAEKAIWVTYEILEKKKPAKRLYTKSDLWECKEALAKYLSRLKELMTEPPSKPKGLQWVNFNEKEPPLKSHFIMKNGIDLPNSDAYRTMLFSPHEIDFHKSTNKVWLSETNSPSTTSTALQEQLSKLQERLKLADTVLDQLKHDDRAWLTDEAWNAFENYQSLKEQASNHQ
jgi:hypothetical protein